MKYVSAMLVLVVFGFALLQAGCVAIDSRAWKEPIAMNDPVDVVGRYSNKAAYKSNKLGFVGASYFSHLVGHHGNPPPESFELQMGESNKITVTFFQEDRQVAQTSFSKARGLFIYPDHTIDLFSYTACNAGGDSLQLGCMRKTVKLFLNPQGDLVTVQSGGGAGLVTIVPFALYGKLVAIFPKVNP